MSRPVSPREQPLDEETLAYLDQLADDAPPLSPTQQDAIAAAFGGEPEQGET